MMDFLVREARAVVEGPMLFVRLGTCGSVGVKVGTVVANTGSYSVWRHPDAWLDPSVAPYFSTKTVPADPILLQHLTAALKKNDVPVQEGLNASTTSFYSDQGRRDPNFDDRNTDWISALLLPSTLSVEMESFHLLHLAHCCTQQATASDPPSSNTIRAATAAIACADRLSGDVIDEPLLHSVEANAGLAVLDAIASTPL